MTQQSQSEVSDLVDLGAEDDQLRPGDLVCTGANVHPNHEVIAVYGDKAWIRDLKTGCDGITSLSRCHKAPAAGLC